MRSVDALNRSPLVFSPFFVAQAVAELDGVSFLATHSSNSEPRERLLSLCRNPQVDHAFHTWHGSLRRIALNTKVPVTEVVRQARLHTPLLSLGALKNASTGRPPHKMFKVVQRRCEKSKLAFENYFNVSAVEKLDVGCRLIVEDDAIKVLYSNGRTVNAYADIVSSEQALLIEGSLHYLQAPREDAVARFGLYVDEAQVPVCYLSFARCDRCYVRSALSRALGRFVHDDEILVLARMFGIGQLPRNTISVMVAEACKRLRMLGAKFIVTAVNPFLGFDGCSMFASGFTPFAVSPVAYNYSESGEYRSRRQGGQKRLAAWAPPPNILFVRGIDRRSRRELSNIKMIYQITESAHSQMSNSAATSGEETTANTQLAAVRRKLYDHLRRVRKDIQDVWSDQTRYHGSEHDPVKPSKGQCGVTSFYLVKNLDKLAGFEVKSALFCEGDVYFPDDTSPIERHCWVRIRRVVDKGPENDLIVDLTADQTGYKDPVIIDTYKNLSRLGIEYKPFSEKPSTEVNVKHLHDRVRILEANLSERVSLKNS